VSVKRRENFWMLCKSCHVFYDFSEKTRLKMRVARFGKPWEIKRKAIGQFDLNDCLIKKWPSLTEASKNVKGNIANISACARGVRGKISYGFKWKYL
jgi:hypothetical protein